MIGASKGEGLIGFSGFVGAALARAHSFDAQYNSSNCEEMKGCAFDLLVCAGVSAVKWLANQKPEADRAGIARLTEALATVEAKEFILISTIDVYDDPASAMDEDGAIDPARNHVYGRHRFELEQWVRRRFANARIARLPALFGPGLRKNALYDLLHDHQVASLNPAGIFQWYPVDRVWNDLATMRRADLALANLFTAPVAMSDIIGAFFPTAAVGPERHPAPAYRLCTRYAQLFGGKDGWILDGEAVLGHMARFIAAERNQAAAPSRRRAGA
jgi:hypothetical protein